MRPMLRALLVTVAVISVAGLAASVAARQGGTSPQSPAAISPSMPEARPEGPPVTEYRLPPEKLRQAEGLYRIHTVLYPIGLAYGIAVLLAVLALRAGARYRDWAERVSRRRFLQAIIFIPLLVLTVDVLELPLGLYRQHLSLLYGLSVQGWDSWAWDWVKGECLGFVLLTPLAWGLYALLRHSPRRWWFYGWLASIPIVVFIVFIAPMVIDPLFNTFEPLDAKEPRLVAELQKVVHRGGLEIPPERMFEMRASEKVTTYNAYVTGLLASKRVVVWDNTAKDLTTAETMFVFGHEMGHYVLNHIWYGLGSLVLGLFVALYLAHLAIGRVLGRWGPRWGIRGLADWASLPALLLTLSVISLVAQPAGAVFSRYLEHQADIYGLEVVHGLVPDSSQVAAQAFQKLGEKALSVPDPSAFYVFWTYSHPPVADRLRFALSYRPWDDGRPGEFFK